MNWTRSYIFEVTEIKLASRWGGKKAAVKYNIGGVLEACNKTAIFIFTVFKIWNLLSAVVLRSSMNLMNSAELRAGRPWKSGVQIKADH